MIIVKMQAFRLILSYQGRRINMKKVLNSENVSYRELTIKSMPEKEDLFTLYKEVKTLIGMIIRLKFGNLRRITYVRAVFK
jgi:hypothetical protein